jgi:homoserine dehydrogenase
MFQDLYMVGGTGSVGSKLVEQIYTYGDTKRENHKKPVRVVGIASKRERLFNPDGLDLEQVKKFSNKKLEGDEYPGLMSLLDEARKEIPEGLVFTDTTALNDLMVEFHLATIEQSPFGIVAANKNPIALHDMDTYRRLTNDRGRYGFRCSVMAGAETVNRLQESRIVGNPPLSISGCFSGTLAYLCSQLEQEVSVQEATQEAYDNDFTEPHPRDDLSGLDVARKLLVLVRTAGFDYDIEDIHLEPFVDRSLLTENDPQKFIDSLASVNGGFSERVTKEMQQGNVPRYVARMQRDGGQVNMNVGLEFVPANGSLGSLKGTLNKVVIVDRTHPAESPYELVARGAGVDITAENMRKEIFAYSLHNLI